MNKKIIKVKCINDIGSGSNLKVGEIYDAEEHPADNDNYLINGEGWLKRRFIVVDELWGIKVGQPKSEYWVGKNSPPLSNVGKWLFEQGSKLLLYTSKFEAETEAKKLNDETASWHFHHHKYYPANDAVALSPNSIPEWKRWRDVGLQSDECACGVKRDVCSYHRG